MMVSVGGQVWCFCWVELFLVLKERIFKVVLHKKNVRTRTVVRVVIAINRPEWVGNRKKERMDKNRPAEWI